METPINNVDKLLNIYRKQTYFELYGGSVVFSVLFMIMLFIAISYITISKKFVHIRKNWNKYKCDPKIIPFAGIINKDPHKSLLDTTSDNFNECATNILVEITGDFLTPIYSLTSGLENLVKVAVNDVQMIRKKISSIVGNVESIDEKLMGRIMNFMIPLKITFIKLRDMIAKTNATMITGMYTGITTYLGLKSFIATFASLMMIPLAFCIITAIILHAFFFTAPLAIPFDIAAGVLGAVLIFVGTLQSRISHH